MNSTSSQKFTLAGLVNVDRECILCYEHECQNGGTCEEPKNVFECTCPAGFEDSLCSTNIDECLASQCTNGQCLDGIANYTCICEPGWTGWM